MATKFSGPGKLLASNFWTGDLDPGPSGQAPKKGVSAISISSRGAGRFLFYATFLFRTPLGPQAYPPVPGG